MLNHITIMGRLVKNPEVKTFNSGKKVTNIRIACDRDYGTGEDKKTDFIDAMAWSHTGEFISKYFSKGRMIVIDGALQMREWSAKDGSKRVSYEINVGNAYFADSKRSDSGSAPSEPVMQELDSDDSDLPWNMDDDSEGLPL